MRFASCLTKRAFVILRNYHLRAYRRADSTVRTNPDATFTEERCFLSRCEYYTYCESACHTYVQLIVCEFQFESFDRTRQDLDVGLFEFASLFSIMPLFTAFFLTLPERDFSDHNNCTLPHLVPMMLNEALVGGRFVYGTQSVESHNTGIWQTERKKFALQQKMVDNLLVLFVNYIYST